jgi:hypothetical protein
MQQVQMYLRANSTLATLVDEFNQTLSSSSVPAIVRGMQVELILTLLDRDGEPYSPLDFDSWEFVLATDWDAGTPPQILVNSGITIDGSNVHVPILNTNTAELAAALSTKESIKIGAELCGFNAGETTPAFVLQFNLGIRNRRSSSGTGTAEPVGDGTYSAAQVDALFAAGYDVQFSIDGETLWHEEQLFGDQYFRIRNAAYENSAYSDAIQLLPGAIGEPGESSYIYVAWATADDGTGFVTEPGNLTNAHKYIAFLVSEVETAELSASDFAGLWTKYRGEDGQGVGDMTKAVYDSDDDGKVNAAVHADSAGAVDWSNVGNKPSEFTPEVHNHSIATLSDPVRQKAVTESNPATLYVDTPIIRKSSHSSSTLNIDFTAIKDTFDGEAYSVVNGDFFTWEYHVPASVNITGIIVGSLNSTMTGISIPEAIDLIGGNNTVHVFAVRGVYKSGAVNNLALQVNYAYSYEG